MAVLHTLLFLCCLAVSVSGSLLDFIRKEHPDLYEQLKLIAKNPQQSKYQSRESSKPWENTRNRDVYLNRDRSESVKFALDRKYPDSMDRCSGECSTDRTEMCGKKMESLLISRLATEGRTFYIVHHNIRATPNANKFCKQHFGGKLASVDSQRIFDKLSDFLMEEKRLIPSTEFWIGDHNSIGQHQELNLSDINYDQAGGGNCNILSPYYDGGYGGSRFSLYSKLCNPGCGTGTRKFICEATAENVKDEYAFHAKLSEIQLEPRNLQMSKFETVNRTFHLVHHQRRANDARKFCQKHFSGGKLASVDSRQILDELSDFLMEEKKSIPFTELWIGDSNSVPEHLEFDVDDIKFRNEGPHCNILSPYNHLLLDYSGGRFNLYSKLCHSGARKFICESAAQTGVNRIFF